MALNELKQGRMSRVLTALAVMVGAAALATPAHAVTGQGTAALILAAHDKGRTLSGQGVKILPAAPAVQKGRALELPIVGIQFIEPGNIASATGEGWLRFKHGKRGIALSEVRFDVSTGTLSGKLGGERIDVFTLNGPASANPIAGSVGLEGAKLRLTAEAATALKQKLGLDRSLRRDGVGMAWLAAKADPTRAAAKAVSSGSAAWGFLASWRKYVLGHQGPPPPAPPTNGTIEVSAGATTTGPLSDPATTYGFPAAAGGSFERGLYGATDKLTLVTSGAVKFAKPMHCINEIELSDMVVKLDGANSSIVSGYEYDVDKFNGMGCDPQPPVTAPGTTIATLDPSGVTPTYTASTVTWNAIPATLTAAGAAAFSPLYKAGQPLDPITVKIEWPGPIAVP